MKPATYTQQDALSSKIFAFQQSHFNNQISHKKNLIFKACKVLIFFF